MALRLAEVSPQLGQRFVDRREQPLPAACQHLLETGGHPVPLPLPDQHALAVLHGHGGLADQDGVKSLTWRERLASSQCVFRGSSTFLHCRQKELVLVLEVTVYGRSADSKRFPDVVETGSVVSVLGKKCPGSRQNLFSSLFGGEGPSPHRGA